MPRYLHAAIVAGALVAFIGLFMYLSNELNRMKWLGSTGQATDGALAFGFSIGASKQDVDESFARLGIEYVAQLEQDGKGCFGYDLPESTAIELWMDRTWPRGRICVSYLDDHVNTVMWSYRWFV